MAWEDIANSEIDQDSPITVTLMTKYRDNLVSALANDDTDTPLFQGGWRMPVTNGSATPTSDATIDFPLSTTAKFHRIHFDLGLSVNAGTLRLNFSNDGGSTFEAGASDYSWRTSRGGSDTADSSIVLASDIGSATVRGVSGNVVIYAADDSVRHTRITSSIVYVSSTGVLTEQEVYGAYLTAEQVDYVRFSPSSGNITGRYAAIESFEP